jgi:NAD(P)-dependent dehydrogenase (short-subunit alcohol dehydrogenase family)
MIIKCRRKPAHTDSSQSAKMKCIGQPQEVADVALWMCSDQSSFITGHAIAVDGGAFA